MDYLLAALLLAFALLGHAALWVGFINRLNAIPLHYLVLRWINRPAMVLCGVIALLMNAHVVRLFWFWVDAPPSEPPANYPTVATYYFMVCWATATLAIVTWVYRKCVSERHPVSVISSEMIDVAQAVDIPLAHGLKARLSSRLPGNQFLQFEVRTLEVELPRLPPELDGLSLVHLTDFHMAGHVGKPYFDEVIRQANRLDADLVLITGDIIDDEQCLPWLELLGELRSRLGIYFVLGNHDYRVCPAEQLREMLAERGLTNVAGTHHLISHNDHHILLAGNELPWHREPVPFDDLPCPAESARILSIALSHTPDEFDWAREGGFDLLLAGHLHGGQIRLPILGPVLSPSRHGVRYSGGTFFRSPTVMHVSRGLSGMMPLRFNCPPELAKLVLRRERSGQGEASAVGGGRSSC